ncbi:MAG TPA: hypothetical protein PLL73_06590 [Syntrophorhabdaceae bacterium]|nr:hypothetical protein [Syntrophorhabdaceae bacterium]
MHLALSVNCELQPTKMKSVIDKLNRIEEWSIGIILLGLAVLTFLETALR